MPLRTRMDLNKPEQPCDRNSTAHDSNKRGEADVEPKTDFGSVERAPIAPHVAVAKAGQCHPAEGQRKTEKTHTPGPRPLPNLDGERQGECDERGDTNPSRSHG